jgi:hypothetical protein
MKKRLFIILSFVSLTSFFNVNSKDIQDHCVITSCIGTVCLSLFEDVEEAIKFSDMAEDFCEKYAR